MVIFLLIVVFKISLQQIIITMLKYNINLRLPPCPISHLNQTAMFILSVGLKARAELDFYVTRVIDWVTLQVAMLFCLL